MRSPLVKITVHFGGLIPPKNSCIGLAFQSVLTLLLKCVVFLINYPLLYDN